MSIIIDKRAGSIHLTNKKKDTWHILQYNSTVGFDKMDEGDCKEAFEELVHRMRREIHESFFIPKTENNERD